MIHRAHQLAAGVAVLALVVAACGSSATPVPSVAPSVAAPSVAPSAAASEAPSTAPSVAPSAAALSVVVIPKQINNPYFDAAFNGAKKAATDFGGTVTQVGPSAADATQQVPFIQTATTQGVSAIVISADDATAVAPSLQAAMAAGVKVVGYDSSPAVGAYNVFVNQADTAGIGAGLAEMACSIAPSCTGEIAILSAAQSATNQNAWIDAMKTTLKDPKYSKLVLDGIVYGNDDPQISTTQAQGLLQAHPQLKVIVAPTSVGIVAAAQVVQAAGKTGSVFVTGLGTPKAMQAYVKSGVAPAFELWNVTNLGYLAYAVAANLANGTIKGTEGETFTVKGLNDDKPYTIGKDSVVILGLPLLLNKANIDEFVASLGF